MSAADPGADVDVEFSDLEALLDVHRHGSMQAAARATGRSRATLRRRLERLEAVLGGPVHVVGVEGVTLTPTGRALVEDTPALLEARDAMLASARGLPGRGSRFRILAEAGTPQRANAIGLATLSQMLPGVGLDVAFDPAPLDRLDDGFDAIVHWGDPPQRGGGFTRVLVRVPAVVQASPTYLERRGVPTSIDELPHHDVLALAGAPPRWPLVGGGHIDLDPLHTTTDRYLLGCLAGADLGLALVPARGVGIDPTVEQLVPVLTDLVLGEETLRIHIPVPSETDGVAARLIAVLEGLNEELAAGLG